MGLLDIFKLQKLKISAFTSGDRSGTPDDSKVFQAMYNPTTYSQTFSIQYSKNRKSGVEYTRQAPSDLSLTIVLDGTGVNEMGVVALTQDSVSAQLKKFFALTYDNVGEIHEPYYLIVDWGILKFSCRLSTVTVKYTLFDRDGTPLRAELAVRFVSDVSAKKFAEVNKFSSPDLTHARVVRHGDTLPLLTRSVYGSSARYLDVARFNGLDDFRRLLPGQTLLFPPLVALDAGGAGSR